MTARSNSYSESIPILADKLVENGSLALMLLDISHFCAIEEQYGSNTYTLVCQRLFDLIVNQAGKIIAGKILWLLKNRED